MKKLKIIIASLALIAAPLLFTPSVGAIDILDEQCDNNPSSAICDNRDDNIESVVQSIVNALLLIVGALSVIMLIYGGIRYTTSGGNATSVTAAKNTILYSIVGLVVAFSAFAIINWVVGRLL